ncbi:MAG: hypothetical protein HY706_08285 [Candidatus Hydrogenedentes bacterium]|nr:hypothetical protein [Candidatus Hydrogenedentota bacterium]
MGDLHFDRKNPRLVEYLEGEEASQERLLEVLWENMAVDEIAMSIAASGYFDHEPLFVLEEEKTLVVIEGNRRLAAVKLLLDKDARERLRATDLPKISATRARSLELLPVIRTTRKGAWQYLGFKHVNGPARWDAYAKAQYIARVRNDFEISLNEIARQIGDKHRTVQRLYRALMVIEQAENAKVFRRDDRYKRHFSFSHLYTGLDYDGIAEFIDLRSESHESRKPVPEKRLKELSELCTWLYGDKSRDLPPVVETQNPDLRRLNEVLREKKATAALRAGLPLLLALDVSYGDERVFRDALIRAKEALQKARATLSTGFQGEDDLLRLGDDVYKLALDLVQEMELKKTPRRLRPVRRTANE